MTTRKTAAAKKTAASSTSTDKTENTTGAEGNEGRDTATALTRTDYGPGTSNPDVPDEEGTAGTRTPATTVSGDPNAAPLEPPADQGGQREPVGGYQTSSTDQAYAESAGRTIAGENHLRLLDDSGNELGADDLFDEDPGLTYVTAKARIFEEFTYPNTHTPAARLMFVPGQRVPRFQAERIKTAVRGYAESDDAGTTSADSAGMGTDKSNVLGADSGKSADGE